MTKTKTKKMGRPCKDPATTRTSKLQIRLTPTEAAELAAWSTKYGLGMAETIRMALANSGVITSKTYGGPLSEAERAVLRAGAARHGVVAGEVRS